MAKPVEILLKGCPIPAFVARFLLATYRRSRLTLAQNHRSDALPNHAFRIRIFQDRIVRVIVNVDKTRRHGHSAGLDDSSSRLAPKVSHRRDLPAADSKVALIGGIPGAVNNATAANKQLKVLGWEQGRCA